ncbi:PREDICTED: calmodulin-like protein 5 [Elephantulus edwardii]|uniref:calmodulin-like protein 5 n=1 Tax=Elephantulus edwardii TaxID=28737 RepID=UPI0003F0E12C|nr:PREDICTED: calmodulin-like protein 5 [Elephantulus edwardii]
MAENLSPEQMEEYKAAFTQFDTDGDGKINLQELGQVMKSLGKEVSEEELKMIMKMVDTDGDGSISFQEFLAALSKARKGSSSEEEMQAAFRVFDVNGDGHITVAELKQAMGNLGVELSDEELDQMIREADTDKDGQVNYQEFARILTSK